MKMQLHSKYIDHEELQLAICACCMLSQNLCRKPGDNGLNGPNHRRTLTPQQDL